MNILITGASGFIGGHLALALADAGHRVYAQHFSHPCPPEVARSAHALLKLDLREDAAVRQAIRDSSPDVVIHTAAVSSIGIAERDPGLAQSVNVEASERLSRECGRGALKVLPRIVYFSTDLVYDGADPVPGGFTETDPPAPVSIYSRTKYAGEEVIRSYCGSHIVLRTALTYGPPIGENKGFMGWLCDSLLAGEEITLFTDEWRTPVFVGDICRTLQAILSPIGERSENTTFHLAGAERISRYDFGLAVAKVFEFDPTLIRPGLQSEYKSAVPRARDASLCNQKISHTLGIPLLDVHHGLSCFPAFGRHSI